VKGASGIEMRLWVLSVSKRIKPSIVWFKLIVGSVDDGNNELVNEMVGLIKIKVKMNKIFFIFPFKCDFLFLIFFLVLVIIVIN
jgi:hypothetical protein